MCWCSSRSKSLYDSEAGVRSNVCTSWPLTSTDGLWTHWRSVRTEPSSYLSVEGFTVRSLRDSLAVVQGSQNSVPYSTARQNG